MATATSFAAPSVEGLERIIYDARGTTTKPGQAVRGEGDPTTTDEAVNRVYDGLGVVYRFYVEAFGRRSLDDRGMALTACVHYGTKWCDSVWDGTLMVFGDGDGKRYRNYTSCLEVIGHELTHGVVQYTAVLSDTYDSRSVRESLCDVFGVMARQYRDRQTVEEASWLVGEGLLLTDPVGNALRSIRAPGTGSSADEQVSHMSRYVSPALSGDPTYVNCGIASKAFHRLAVTLGGHAWERAGRIWYGALTGQLGPAAGFVELALASRAAAQAQFGGGSVEVAAVVAAWGEVGIAI